LIDGRLNRRIQGCIMIGRRDEFANYGLRELRGPVLFPGLPLGRRVEIS